MEDTTKALILLWTGISEDEHNELVFIAGCKYNEIHLGNQPEITHYAAYWEWYKNEWSRAEDVFETHVQMDTEGRGLIYRGEFLDVSKLRLVYTLHQANWFNGKYPNAVVMRETYGKMVHKLVKKETRKGVTHG